MKFIEQDYVDERKKNSNMKPTILQNLINLSRLYSYSLGNEFLTIETYKKIKNFENIRMKRLSN
jgi:hypothetical protein